MKYRNKKQNKKDIVVFRKEEDGNVVAFFPLISAKRGHIVCYSHNGQHSEADLGYYVNHTKACNKYAEYINLKHELESEFGYKLEIADMNNESTRMLKRLANIVIKYDKKTDRLISLLQKALDSAGIAYEDIRGYERVQFERDDLFCQMREVLRIVKKNPELLSC